MKRLALLLILIIALLPLSAAESQNGLMPLSEARSQNTVLSDFIAEPQMKADLLQMLADFTTYVKADFQECVEPNSLGEACGCFKGEHTMHNDEKGVRPNADLSMICAFLVKYGQGEVTLPKGVTWDDLREMAKKSLVFAYSTHKANRLKPCAGNRYWGSTSTSDKAWESSLWAMSVAYSAFFQWERLSDAQRNYIYQLLKAECNYELHRTIPTGYRGDTKSEENGWETNVLAVTLGLFPDDPLAPQWFQRLRAFAINGYSQKDDAADETVIDPDYDGTRVKDLYRGANLYDDFTLQNHNYFHTSYQNAVVQELGESALALRLFQRELHGTEKWKSNALMHNNQRVMDQVLYWLALSDSELAMPNGNDWSLFLYDQITSYTTQACFLRDPHALMLENRAYRMIKARQQTTADGSWLLRPDVGARRMGVQAHRVMMTWLMHELLPTADLTPTSWHDFRHQYSAARVFTSQNVVRALNEHRFTCFSWSEGLKSYTGYFSPNVSGQPSTSNLIVPFRANNTGNFIGWYEVEGHKTNATPVVSGHYDLRGCSFVMNGELQTNDATLNNRFVIFSTPGNAIVYMDHVRANTDCTINKEKGGLMAVSVDEFTKKVRTFHTTDGARQLDGAATTVMNGPWVNIDQQVGIITSGHKLMAFGERANNTSVLTARLYTSYYEKPRPVKAGETVDSRAAVYYSNVDAQTTAVLSKRLLTLTTPDGWHGLIAFDPDETAYLLLSNFAGDSICTLRDVATDMGAPVFTVPTTIRDSRANATFRLQHNRSCGNTLRFFIEGNDVEATQADGDPATITLRSLTRSRNSVTVHAFDDGQHKTYRLKLNKKKPTRLTISH